MEGNKRVPSPQGLSMRLTSAPPSSVMGYGWLPFIPLKATETSKWHLEMDGTGRQARRIRRRNYNTFATAGTRSTYHPL
jgi:hypothetical protein